MSANKPEFLVAGPGAGKTHGMVELIEGALKDLSPHRQLAAITYTNAAANTIRSRLSKNVSLPKNVFIGTTHAFLNRFILQPYSTLFDELPSERIFSAIEIDGAPQKRNAILKNLRNRGVVSYDAMLSVSVRLAKKASIRKRLGNRLQYLFIDEIQDVDDRQKSVIEEIIKPGKTKLYFVGDPEQYISGHTYRNSGKRTPEFTSLPFMKLKSASIATTETVNRRANGELVDFANQFRADIQQTSEKPHRNKRAVYFLSSTNLVDVINEFRKKSLDVEFEGDEIERLYLSYTNAAFDEVRHEHQIIHISNQSRKQPTLLGDASDLLLEALGLPIGKVLEKYALSKLKWRSIAIELLKNCCETEYSDSDFWKFIKLEFDENRSSSRSKSVSNQLSALKSVLAAGAYANNSDRSSSIHRAKGLEADATLVLARTANELSSWLETDKSNRHSDKQDKCRLGYVAATRSRELLCFACLKEIDETLEQRLEELGIELA